jgi:hypothetical protein
MKKIIFVLVIFAMVSCSKRHEQVEPNQTKNSEIYDSIVDEVFDERKYRIQRDTFHGVDEQTGDLYMIVEETKIYE